MSVKTYPVPGSPLSHELMPASRNDVALNHAAYVAAKLMIARWQNTSRHAHLNLCLPHNESARARWFARTQQGLEEWIAQGGFSRPDEVRAVQPTTAVQASPVRCVMLAGSCTHAAGQCERACVD